ncbi:hypothetical protein [Nannocystis sp. SCPEA4]|uniref:hypothetical protein n=1 Tax=Nannocystis sp. SCPEA4 TaxID=2996787 RepID=UPI0022712001|nr:hypothetical protein [Nannocystis sp. SCPEA4]MCY1060178.1 hypothetical protein [Nannocystis sp. SCPEA4]
MINDGCDDMIECFCPGDVACLQGVCETSCDVTSFSILNNQKNEEHQCGLFGSAQITSVMFVKRENGDVISAGEGQWVGLEVPSETTEKISVTCCLTSDDACAQLEFFCDFPEVEDFCECTSHDSNLMANSCDPQNIQGCP